MHPTPRRAARVVTSVVAALLLVLAPACGTIGAFIDLQEDLEDAGFSDVDVNVDSGAGGDALRIEATPPPGATPEEGQEQAAQVAWTTFPRRFERLQLNIGGQSVTLERQELEQRFGPRDPDLDDKELEDDIRNLGIGVLIALAVGLVLCVGLIILIIVLVRRSGKKKRQNQQQWGGPGYGQPQHPQQYPQQYGQQPQYPQPPEQPGWAPPPGQQQPPPGQPGWGAPPGQQQPGQQPPPGQNPPGWS
jgi:hypothetical protein